MLAPVTSRTPNSNRLKFENTNGVRVLKALS
jgi:hypothetical protein